MTTVQWVVPDPERLIDLTRRLSTTDSFVDTMAEWAGEPLALRLSALRRVERSLPLDAGKALGIADVPVLLRSGVLYGVRSSAPVAEVSSVVATGRLPLGDVACLELDRLLAVRGATLGRALREVVPDLERHTVRVAPVARSDASGEPQALGVRATLLSQALGVTLAVVEEYVYTQAVNNRRG